MTALVLWLLAAEVVGLAALPIAVWFLRWLPDHGYIFAKALGLLVVTYIVWLVGSVAPIAGGRGPTIVALFALGVAVWIWGLDQVREAFSSGRRTIAIEEGLFVGGFVVYALLRAQVFGAAINHTEQFMDMAFLNSAVHSRSYPPFDTWMSGHSINYYYFGYMMFATLIKLSGVVPEVGYNLALGTVFAFALAGIYSIGLVLTRHRAWALLAPGIVLLVGNWHALLWQIPHSGCSSSAARDFWGWMWPSTRVIGSGYVPSQWACTGFDHSATITINEYPLFSFVLGDLHPHVMSLLVTLLAIAAAANIVVAPVRAAVFERETVLRLALTGLCIGALFTVNSWDFPTYALLVACALGANAYIRDPSHEWWQAPLAAAGGLGALSLLLYLPFYAHFRSLSDGLGLVTTPTAPYEFTQVFGLMILLCVLLAGALWALLAPAEELAETEEPAKVLEAQPAPAGERGASQLVWVVAGASAGAAALITHQWVLLLLLCLMAWCGAVGLRVVNTVEPNTSDILALLLIGVGLLVIALPEVIYLRDVFDGSASYRMNTVFKFYYQAWLLLGLAGAYGAVRAWTIVQRLFGGWERWGVALLVIAGIGGAAAYTRYIPAYAVGQQGAATLDGAAWLRQQHPGDYAAMLWLRDRAPAGSVILEATRSDYDVYGDIATFAGLPTVMGWAGHEGQWRLHDNSIQQRVDAVNQIYTRTSIKPARHLLRHYSVRFVVVGDQEHQAYGDAPGLTKFSRFMRVAFRSGATTVYTW